MRLLLPPSETKRPGGSGRPLDERDPHPDLGPARERVLRALHELLQRPDAARALLLPDAVRDAALRADERVASAPTLPALRRYAGVVYDGLGYAALTPPEQRTAARCTYIFSGLFGVVGGAERIPDYRVPAKAVLPDIGTCGTFWRPVLDQVLPRLLGRGPVIDLRSTDYAAMWRPERAFASRVITVRVLSPTPSGRLAVVSYASKLAKGVLAAALIRRVVAGQPVRSPDDVAAAWSGRADVLDSQVVLYTSA